MAELERLRKMLNQIEVEMPEETLEALLWFRDELLRWNKRINLTAITDPSETLEKHLVDSLTLLPYLPHQGHLLDMGSGGGFPGIPLKIARPALSIWSVDAVAKKIAFQKHVARSLKMVGFTALHERLEDLPDIELMPRFDVVLARAFASLAEIVHLAKPLLTPRGEIVAMKGAEGLQELTESAAVLKDAGFGCTKKEQLQLPESKAQRILLFLTRTDKA